MKINFMEEIMEVVIIFAVRQLTWFISDMLGVKVIRLNSITNF